jgi:hypothetical protein
MVPCPRLTVAMILSGSAVQMKGFGSLPAKSFTLSWTITAPINIISHCASPACLHRQAGLGAIEGLDLALLDREHDLSLDGIEEADELLMSVALHAAADNPAVENIESGEERGSAAWHL